MDFDILSKAPKKTPDELIEDLLKIITDAGYGVTNISSSFDCCRNHNIFLDIEGCSELGKPIKVLRLKGGQVK